MESQPQNPELRNNPENFHPCDQVNKKSLLKSFLMLHTGKTSNHYTLATLYKGQGHSNTETTCSLAPLRFP